MDATYQYLVRMLAHEMKHYADRKLDEYNVTQEQKSYVRLHVQAQRSRHYTK